MMVSDMSMLANLILLPLGLYNVVVDMDWIVNHKTKIDYYSKLLECLSDEGKKVMLYGIRKPITFWKISTMQVKRCNRKWCSLYAIQATNKLEANTDKMEDNLVLRQFNDVLLEEILGLPPMRETEFSIEPLLGPIPVLKAPYHMSFLVSNPMSILWEY